MTSLQRFRLLLFVLAILSLVHNGSHAQDWPGWRGPGRDALVRSFSPPKSWPEQLKTKWSVEVGLGHSSPVFVAQQIFLHTRQGDDEVVTCVDSESGTMKWQNRYTARYAMNPAAVSHGKGPKSTPLAYNGRLYTLGISGILSSYELGSGELVWRKDFSKEFKVTSPLYGSATSPVAHDDLVIVHVGGDDSGALRAFDRATGNVRWSWNGDGPSYASPVIAELGGISQLITLTQKSVAGFAPATGKLLWQIPFETEYVQNIVTPVVYNQTVIFSGIDKGTTAVKLVRRGEGWTTQTVWQNPEVSMYMSSPVVNGDYLYGLSHKRKGQLFCLDARTGRTVWTTEGRFGDNAAILKAGDLLLMLTNDAELIVAPASPSGFKILRKYTVATSPTWAHPMVLGSRILIKSASTLALLSLE